MVSTVSLEMVLLRYCLCENWCWHLLQCIAKLVELVQFSRVQLSSWLHAVSLVAAEETSFSFVEEMLSSSCSGKWFPRCVVVQISTEF